MKKETVGNWPKRMMGFGTALLDQEENAEVPGNQGSLQDWKMDRNG